jgi:hypothetical protein
MGAWLHGGLSSQRLELLRVWALRAAEQSREYGEAEAVWEGYLATADRASDLLDQRASCRGLSRYAGCSSLQLRSSVEDRNQRSGCFFPLCLLSDRRIPPGHIRFNFNKLGA